IFIKDTKSSNGTFINGERLSPENVESDPYELKNHDRVQFGIDIVAEDEKTIVHHKVVARIVCIFSKEDAIVVWLAECLRALKAFIEAFVDPPTIPLSSASHFPPSCRPHLSTSRTETSSQKGDPDLVNFPFTFRWPLHGLQKGPNVLTMTGGQESGFFL
ncbi:hypothetical protein BT96DRAFT_817989, partial [Gymnopus androsaceus JB14]